MGFITSTSNFKLHPSLTFGLSPPHNNPNTTKLSFPSKPLIPIISSLSNHITLNNFPNHICKYLQYPYPDPDPSRTHKHIRSIRAKTSAIPVPELESKTHKIWWSDVEVKYPKNVFGRKLKEWDSVDILNLCFVGGIHVLALFAPFTFTWKAVWMALGLGIITGWLGITLSYHRNLAHSSFKLPKWLEYIFAYCGILAAQGDPIGWVSTHRYHHQICDTEKDPHTPRKGFWVSHINWLFDTKAFGRHETQARLSSQSTETSNLEDSKSQDLPPSINDLSSTSPLIGLPKCGETNNVEDLEKQPFYRFIRSTYIVHLLLFGLLFYAFGGFPYLVWGMGVRTTVAYHATFLVGSAGHLWGHQSWNTGDLSKNNWWVALLTSGEGWHNNHHAFPYSARHGMKWWQIDMTWYAIKLLQILGLATDVKLPTEVHKKRLALKHETTQANEIN